MTAPHGIDRVTLEITQPYMNPKHRPDDITWTLRASDTEEFGALVGALLSETRINDAATLGELIELRIARNTEELQRIAAAFDEPVPTGTPNYTLELHAGDATALRLFLNTCRLTAHYEETFKPKLIELGSKSTFSHQSPVEDERIERKPPPTTARFEDLDLPR